MNSKIPKEGRPYGEILEQLESFAADDPDYKNAKTWSLVYYLDEEYTQFLAKAYEKFFSANGLNPTAFHSLKRFEKEIVGFTAELFHVDEEACGVMTAGGTESCMLAVKTYRDWGRAKGIKKPEMIVPETAHVAWGKGAEYFGVKVRKAGLADDYRVDVNAVKKLINKNTVMILAGAPEYPHGMIDPVEELAALAKEHKIPMHVDACVGGYILPFIEASGIELPLWDFRVPGVTSISADIHKYGFAAKGASCILYRSIDYFKHQVYVEHDWPGGVFASPALLGTRPGGAYAAAWAAIQANGMDGYTQLARRTMDAVNRIKAGIAQIPELEVIGNPPASLISYRSTDPDVNIFAVGDVMQTKGWHIDRLQHPDALHAMVTAPHEKVVDIYINDLKDAVAHVKAHPELAQQGEAATYGMIAHIPLKGMVRKSVLDMFANSYKLSAKEIDLSDSAAISSASGGGESGGGSKQGIVDKAIAWYVKKSSAKQKQRGASKTWGQVPRPGSLVYILNVKTFGGIGVRRERGAVMKKPLRIIVGAMILLAALCVLFTFSSFSVDTAIGDADHSGGRPTVADAREILRAAAKIKAVTDKAVYDVNGDGFVRVDDARNVLRAASDLPVGGITVSANGYIMPKDGWSFSDYSAGRCTAVEYAIYSNPSDTSATSTTSAPVTTTATTTFQGVIDKDGIYTTKEDVSLYIHTYSCLPSNFITKSEAKALGWPGGSLEPYAPGKCIGGDLFGNYEGKLPTKSGRKYYECDIDTLGADDRGAKRLVYSNDGLIYYTADHYEYYMLLYGAP